MLSWWHFWPYCPALMVIMFETDKSILLWKGNINEPYNSILKLVFKTIPAILWHNSEHVGVGTTWTFLTAMAKYREEWIHHIIYSNREGQAYAEYRSKPSLSCKTIRTMNQHAGLATWMLLGAKPKWLFYEAAELEAEQDADSSSTKTQDQCIIFRWGWKDYATSLIVCNEQAWYWMFISLEYKKKKGIKESPQHGVIFKGKIMM